MAASQFHNGQQARQSRWRNRFNLDLQICGRQCLNIKINIGAEKLIILLTESRHILGLGLSTAIGELLNQAVSGLLARVDRGNVEGLVQRVEAVEGGRVCLSSDAGDDNLRDFLVCGFGDELGAGRRHVHFAVVDHAIEGVVQRNTGRLHVLQRRQIVVGLRMQVRRCIAS
jgi:hypothetical protein